MLVSDTSTDAERLIASLRARGFKVRDVPLALLAGRIEFQHPDLVICDPEVPRMPEIAARVRSGEWGAKVRFVLLGKSDDAKAALSQPQVEGAVSLFARPIDVYSVLQGIEDLLGVPHQAAGAHALRSMAAMPRLGELSSNPPRQRMLRLSSPPPAAPSARSRSAPPSASPPPSLLDPLGSRRLPSIPPGSDSRGSDPLPPSLKSAKFSAELEGLLEDAERRLVQYSPSHQSQAVVSERLTPEQELDAILPADVLAALDEALELDDEDDTSNPGPGGLARSSAGQRAQGRQERTGPGTGTSSRDEVETGVGRTSNRPHGTDARVEAHKHEPLPPPGVPHQRDGACHPAAGATVGPKARQPLRDPSGTGTTGRRATETEAGADDDGQLVSATPDISSTAPPKGAPRRTAWSDLSAAQGAQYTERAPMPSTPPYTAAGEALTHAPVSEPLPRTAPPQVERRPNTRQGIIGATTGRSLPPHDLPPYDIARLAVSTRPPLRPSPVPRGRPSEEPRGRSGEGNASSRAGRPDGARSLAPGASGGESKRSAPSVPAALAAGDVLRALAHCVRSRLSGALVVEDEFGIRRIVLREGDFVMVASGLEGESLVAFLVQRGDLQPEAMKLERKLPQFGRHAGAALIAHGYLRQDELWPVLRAHAEWLLGRAFVVERGSASVETELPARLQTEPAVFGGTTGAEVLVEVTRRVLTPEAALSQLGGSRRRLGRGGSPQLLSECALGVQEMQAVERAPGLTIAELLSRVDSPDFSAALRALVELDVIQVLSAGESSEQEPEPPAARDSLDDGAVRIRVRLRRELVDEGDYFSLLGVSRDATGYEIRHAYLDLRREFEPGTLLTAATADLREDVDIVLEVIDEAYEILRDAARRGRYRRALEAKPR